MDTVRLFIFLIVYSSFLAIGLAWLTWLAMHKDPGFATSGIIRHFPLFTASVLIMILVASVMATLAATRLILNPAKKNHEIQPQSKDALGHDRHSHLPAKDPVDELTTTSYEIISGKVNEIRIDPQTCSYTKPYIIDTLTHELLFSQTGKQCISLVQFSIDQFAHLKGRHGDEAIRGLLQQFSIYIQSHILRPKDSLGCLSENCFVWLLLQTRADETQELCRKLKDELQKNPFRIGDENIHPVLSMGVANLNPYIVDAASMLEAAAVAHRQAAAQNAGKIVYSQGSLPKHMTIMMDF